MSDQGDVEKVNEESASRGEMGQRYLASGEYVSMRLWEDEQPGNRNPRSRAPTRRSDTSSVVGPISVWRER